MKKALFFALSLIFSTLSFSTVSLANPIPAEHFAKWPEYYDAVLSPNGRYIAVERSADEGKTTVAVVDTANLTLVSHVPATGGRSPINPRWISNERLVLEFTEESHSREHEFYSGELMAINADGKIQRDIIRHTSGLTSGASKQLNNLNGWAKVIHELPKDSNSVLIRFQEFSWARFGNDYSYYELNTKTGRPKFITKAPSYNAHLNFSVDGDPLFSIGFAKDNTKINELVVHHFVEGKWELMKPEGLDAAEEFFVIAQGSAPDEVYVQARFANKTDRIYRYNLNTGARTLVFAHAKVDPAEYIIDPQNNQLIGVHFNDGYPNLHLIDENHLYSRWYPALFQLFDGNRVNITSASENGEKLIVHVSGANEPGQFHLFDTKTKKLRYLFNAAAWIDSSKLAKVEPISFKARDGQEIHGYLTTPDSAEKPSPLIVMPHGGPHRVRDNWIYDPTVQFLASRGYAVLQVNFRGSGGYGWGFETAGHRQWGALTQHDIIDGTKWAASKDSIDAQRIGILGGSFGGYSALMSPILEPDLYKCAVGFVGVYDLELMWKTGDIEKRRQGENYLEKVIGKDKNQLALFSPAKRVNELKAPVFLIHGEADWRVDVAHYDLMKELLEKKGHPHEGMSIKKEGHGFANEKNRLEYLQRVEAFLAKHLASK